MSDRAEIKLNGESFSVESGCTVEGLLTLISKNKTISSNRSANFGAVAVELNEEIVPRDQFAQTKLEEGDAVEVVTLVGGG